ncbi:MAG TPA: hypothetical protein VE395_00465 [Acidimicrobiales bacterium]|nr:hypothetical protein [Acidimicrobiales bacterium]
MTDAPGPEQMGERRFAAHNMIAVYPTVEAAREALTRLERKGIEAGNIELLGAAAEGAAEPQTNIEQRRADMAMTGRVGRRSAVGIVIGAAIGAVVVGLAALLADAIFDLGPTGVVAGGGALAGALFGAFAGMFYGGATGLPVSDAWSETFEAVKQGQTAVAVHSQQSDQVDDALDALRDTGATTLSRFGADGKLQGG